MSETTDTPETGQTGQESGTGPRESGTEVQEPDTDVQNPAAAAKGRENSKLRERLRHATERLAVLQRAEAERLAADKLGAGTDLWAAGVDLQTLLDEEGNVSPDLVAQAAAQAIEAHPHWKRRVPSVPASTVTGNGKIEPDTRTTFEDAFKPRDKRRR